MIKKKKIIAAAMAAIMMGTPLFNWDFRVFAAQLQNQNNVSKKDVVEQETTYNIKEGMIDTKNYDYLALNEEMEESLYAQKEELSELFPSESLEEPEPLLENADDDLPSSVDWSTSEYFPKVGDQGSSGSCWHYGTVYACVAFANNKERGIVSTDSNTLNPIFGYNYAQKTNTTQLYLLREIGYPNTGVLPINTKNMASLFPIKEVWENALLNRGGDLITVDNFGEEDAVITGPKDASLNTMKQTLNSGKLIAFGSYSSNWNKSVVASGEHKGEIAIDRCDLNKTGGHIIALVGYDDDIWIDINYDGKVQEAEMGAFKFVNSWGDDWGNDGFMWVAYDAINKTSQVLTKDEATRINNEIAAGTIKANKVNNNVRKSFFMFSFWSYAVVREKTTSECLIYMTVNTGSRREMNMSIKATNKDDGTEKTYTLPKLNVETDNLAWDGTAKSTDGTMVLDLDNVISDISSDTMEDYTWEVTFEDDTADSYALTVKDLYFTVNGTKKYTTSLSKIPLNGSKKTYTMALRTADSKEDKVITEENKKNVIIYYANSNFKDANIHYKVGSGTWTKAPGVQMCVDNEQSGYNWRYVINLGSEKSLTVCFNENNTSWDNNSENNYTLKAGCYGIKNGVITELQEPVTPSDPLIELDKKSISIYENESTAIEATVIDGSSSDIIWTSSDEDVATVSTTGKVSAVGVGTATITATIKDISASCEITVQEKAVIDKPEITETPKVTKIPAITEVPKITSIPQNDNIQLDKTTINISVGGVEKLAATIKGETQGTITWSSADETIAVVSNTGKVVGVGAGTTAIIATVDGDSAVCQVTVKEKAVTDIPETTKIPQASGIELDKTTIEISVGTVENLIATIKGETEDIISWNSDDETIAVVSNTGKVVAVGAGTTTIMASVDGNSAICRVTVTGIPETTKTPQVTATDIPETTKTPQATVTDIPETTKIPQATGIELDKTTIEVSVGTVENLIATIKGETVDTIRWESGDETIAVVSNTGKVVAVSVGTTIVTATVDEVSVSCIVNVSDTRLTLNKQKYTLYTAGRKKVSLKALLNGEDLKETSVSWYSSDSEVAKVSSSGVVTARKKGKTTITAIDSNGLMATCTITIKKPAIKVKTKSVVTLKKGKTLKISATSTPGGKFTYKTSSKGIATVSSKGVVTAKKKGTAYITISRNGVKKRIKVIVK